MTGTRCDFFDVIINKNIIDKIKQNNKLCMNILDYITRKFVIFSSDKFKLFTDSVKILQNKIYKGIEAKPSIFQSKLETDKKIINPQKNSDNQNIKKKDEIIISSQAKYEENKLNEEAFIKESNPENSNVKKDKKKKKKLTFVSKSKPSKYNTIIIKN